MLRKTILAFFIILFTFFYGQEKENRDSTIIPKIRVKVGVKKDEIKSVIMKKITSILALLCTLFVFGQASHIEIEVHGISNSKGNIGIALYNNAKNFTKKELKAIKIKAKLGKIFTTFKNLPVGEYGIAVFHDENSNNQMDFNLIGIPKEDYGFSNNPKIIMSAPKFKDVSFKLNKNEIKKIKIKLK